MPAMRAKQDAEKMVAPRRAAGGNPAMAGRLPRYISQHAIACLTRQALQAIIAELKRGEMVKCIRFVSDSFDGKLLCEFEASDKETVLAFLPAHNMRPQWVMRVANEW